MPQFETPQNYCLLIDIISTPMTVLSDHWHCQYFETNGLMMLLVQNFYGGILYMEDVGLCFSHQQNTSIIQQKFGYYDQQ